MPLALYRKCGPVGFVTLNRPDRLNAISGALLEDLTTALKTAQQDEGVAAIVLSGAGRAFCSGDDLKEYDLQTADERAIRSHVVAIQRITRLIMGEGKPVICAAHGYAVGGGFEWLLNCDLVVASENLQAFFPEMKLGQFVTGGVTHLLPRTVGYQRAMELLLLGEIQSAARLERLGVVNFVVPDDQVLPKATELARTLALQSPQAIARLKNAINVQLGAELWQSVEVEQTLTIEAFRQPDTAARVRRHMPGKKGSAA
jgi:enoyl-CoA hydratase/carnithine racemase